jgi:hypothetical protein
MRESIFTPSYFTTATIINSIQSPGYRSKQDKAEDTPLASIPIPTIEVIIIIIIIIRQS